MDNKQNRQFFWNVKDFLQKTPEAPETKSSPLKNTIHQIMNVPQHSNSSLREEAKNLIVNSSNNIKNQVSSVLSSYQTNIDSQQPKSSSHSKTITTNIFKMFGR